MTQQAELFRKIEKLPPQYFGEVIDFVGYLQYKALNGNKPLVAPTGEMPKERIFGCSKGKYRMADDFDAPLDDFKDYM